MNLIEIGTVTLDKGQVILASKYMVVVCLIALMHYVLEKLADRKRALDFREEYKELVYPIYTSFEIADVLETTKSKIALLETIDELVLEVINKRNNRSYYSFNYKKYEYDFDKLFELESNILNWSKSMQMIPIRNLEKGVNEVADFVMQYFTENRREIIAMFRNCNITHISMRAGGEGNKNRVKKRRTVA